MKMNQSGEAGSDGGLGNDKSSPKDGQVMASILKDMGIMEYEPRVINQLLEFAYRYMTTILDDAKMVSGHAKKKAVDADDIKLAVQMYAEENLTTPPGRDVLLETARTRNTLPLPLPKPTCGLRLPPERFCMTNANFRLTKIAKKKQATAKGSGSTFSNQNNPTTPKMLVAPPGSTLIQQSSTGLGGQQPKLLVNAAMPKFQIQSAGQPVFNLTVNPHQQHHGVKRKAAEMDGADQ